MGGVVVVLVVVLDVVVVSVWGLDGSVCPQPVATQRQSLRHIDMGQCLCTDPYSNAIQ